MDAINSIDNTYANTDVINGEKSGYKMRAETTPTTQPRNANNELDQDKFVSSQSAMISAELDAEEEGEPIVAPLWQPHYVFAEADLKFLEDPKESFGEVEEIFMATREGFESDQEEVYNWLKNFKLDEDQLGDLMLKVE